MKRILVAAILASMAFALSAQQIVKVAVVDFDKVFQTYYPESKEVKAYNELKAKIEAELEKLRSEITTLDAQKKEAEKSGNASDVTRLQTEIDKKKQAYKEYFTSKEAELKAMEKSINSGDLIQQIYKAIQYVAEQEGFMLVLNSKSSMIVGGELLWYSPVVDLTQKVIDYLMGKLKVIR